MRSLGASGPVRALLFNLSGTLHWTLGVVIVGIAVSVAANFVYGYATERVHVEVVRTSKRAGFALFQTIYETRIREEVRVDPRHMARYADDRKFSPRSFRWLRRHSRRRPSDTLHFIVIAKIRGDVRAFAKIILCADSSTLFIAYVGSHDRRALRCLLDHVHSRTVAKLGTIKYVVYEVDGFHSEAPDVVRKLDAYANSFGLHLYRYQNYLMPDMDPSRSSNSVESEALLVIGTTANPGSPPTQDEIYRVIRSIYFDIYADTFRFNDNLDTGYRSYLTELAELVSVEMAGES